MQHGPEQTSWSALPLAGRVIALDAGHGGLDGGAVSASGIVEKEITLAIALLLRDYLQEAGAAVIMTREDDSEHVNPGVIGRKRQDLTKRVEIVNNSNADLMISIHLNSIGSSRWRGAQTFYQPNRSEDHARLAKLIQAELIRNLENTNRAAKPLDRNILLMREVNVPAALVEVGFLSNPEEAALLSSPEYQKKVAAAIYRGILRYASGEKLGS
jgi:N-acetylmuramoyl-L-alanine amidase